VTLDFRVEVTNPYTVALPVVGLVYSLSTNERPFLDGTNNDLEASIPAQGISTITLPVRVDLVGLVETLGDVRPGQVIPYEARLGLSVDVPAADPFVLPLSHSGELPIPAPPQVSVASFDWDEVSLDEVKGTLLMDLTNPNEFAFTLKSFEYDLSLGERKVAAGEGSRSTWLNAGSQGQIPVSLSFSPGSAGTALLGMLGGTLVDYSLRGSLDIETPYGMVSAPFENSGRASQTR
jgi:LEA14-like dessication related protein